MTKRDDKSRARIAVGMIGNRQLMMIADAQYWTCPHCGKIEDAVFIGQSIWACCKTHKVKWLTGWDLSLSEQATEAQKRRYYEMGADKFEDIYRERLDDLEAKS
jgi:hypothetical protein